MRLPMSRPRGGRAAVLLLAVFVLTACGVGGSPDPVTAVVSDLSKNQNVTPVVHAAIPTSGGVLVLYTFQQGSDCYIGETLAEQRRGVWYPAMGGQSGGPCPATSGASAQAYTTGSAGSGSSGGHTWSLANGHVFDPTVTRIDITWDDGVVTPAVITNGVCYSLREGVQATPTTVQGYDHSDQPVPAMP